MPNLIIKAGQMTITPFFWSLSLAFLLSSFSIWRKLRKEEYSENDIFSISILMLVSGLVFEKAFFYLFDIKIFGALLGMVLVALGRFKLLGINIWDGFDSLALPVIYFSFFGGLGYFLTTWTWLFLGYCLVGIIGFGLYYFFKKRYRRLSWYKSGKTGFLFFAVCLYFSVAFLILDLLQTIKLYWSDILWIVLFSTSITVIYKRGILK